MTQGNFCTNCGAVLEPGVHFCDNCGQAVGASTSAPARQYAPVSPSHQRRFPWWTLILGIGCLGVLCLAAVAVGGLAYFSDLNIVLPALPGLGGSATSIPATTMPAPSLPVQPSQPTNLSNPTAIPSPIATPTDYVQALTGNQRLNEHSLYDDFSSDALGWPIFDDGKTIIKYENQAYSFQIAEPDYTDWAYFPVDFTPYEIWFDVQGLPGRQDGTFGVFCQYQDADNYYYAEFDLQDNSYILAQIVNGEDIPLTKQNSVGQYWYETSALRSSPDAINRIGITCYLESITLFINDQWVDEVSVQQSFDTPGEAAFFVYAFDFAGENGYKVVFDNVEVWEPVQ
jgi:hypothetical protein